MFLPLQILNLIQLAAQHAQGSEKPFTNISAKYRIGTASLIMSDLLMNQKEREALKSIKNQRYVCLARRGGHLLKMAALSVRTGLERAVFRFGFRKRVVEQLPETALEN